MGSFDFSWKLKDHPKLPKGKTVAVVVLSGWGEAYPDKFNCIHVGDSSASDELKATPERWRLLRAHGMAVGLPNEHDVGNSEVGHNALGAGRICAQGAKLVDLALASGKIYDGEGFKYIKKSFDNGTLHLIVLLSDGCVHSRLDQLQLFVKGASKHGAKRIRVHILTDGHIVLDRSYIRFVETLENGLANLQKQGIDVQIASGGGQMYVTMKGACEHGIRRTKMCVSTDDHDFLNGRSVGLEETLANNLDYYEGVEDDEIYVIMNRYEIDWDIVIRGWCAHVLGEAPYKFQNAVEAVNKFRSEPEANEQYLPPFIIVDASGKAVGPIVDGDAVVSFNYQPDRMVLLAKALEYDFDTFDRVQFPKIRYAEMLHYDGELKVSSQYLVSPPMIDRTSGEYLVHNGVRTFACSETVKFEHITYYWNGNRQGYFDSKMEEYVEIPSNFENGFDVRPEMKAIQSTMAATEAILSRKFDQVRINLANCDVVAHTGDTQSTAFACESVDMSLQDIISAIEQVGGIFLVTSDHGNAEDMVKRDKSAKPLVDKGGNVRVHTSHTLHPVPIAIGGPGLARGVRFRKDLPHAGLANVAATIINLHGFEAPSDYEPSLIEVVDG